MHPTFCYWLCTYISPHLKSIFQIACDVKIQVTIYNTAKLCQGAMAGNYYHNGEVNDQNYWVKDNGRHAIWYLYEDGYACWVIGSVKNLGTNVMGIASSKEDISKNPILCPQKIGKSAPACSVIFECVPYTRLGYCINNRHT